MPPPSAEPMLLDLELMNQPVDEAFAEEALAELEEEIGPPPAASAEAEAAASSRTPLPQNDFP